MSEMVRQEHEGPASSIPMVGRRTRLRPLSARFIDVLYELAVTDQIPWIWNSPVQTPDAFRRSLSADVLVQFMIEQTDTGRPVGIISAYRPNLFHGYAYVAFTLLPNFRMRAWPLEAAVLFGNYLFVRYSFEVIYAETAAPYFEQFKSGSGNLFEVEGRLKRRMLINGEREDLYILAFSRRRWLEEGVPAVERLTALRRSNPSSA